MGSSFPEQSVLQPLVRVARRKAIAQTGWHSSSDQRRDRGRVEEGRVTFLHVKADQRVGIFTGRNASEQSEVDLAPGPTRGAAHDAVLVDDMKLACKPAMALKPVDRRSSAACESCWQVEDP